MADLFTNNFVVLLDSCVLWPASLRDTLLRLAETPCLYIPKWTEEIWREVTRNLESRRKLTTEQIKHLKSAIDKHFPEAFVTGYEKLIPFMTNDPKDRHVLAAAVKCGAQLIVTSNLKDFPREATSGWEIEAQHPDEFLIDQYDLKPALVIRKLYAQAEQIKRPISSLLCTLRKGVPAFADAIARDLEIDLSAGECSNSANR
jgi:predicted nucleic acid-binding protein